jgi:hypothetical protein
MAMPLLEITLAARWGHVKAGKDVKNNAFQSQKICHPGLA